MLNKTRRLLHRAKHSAAHFVLRQKVLANGCYQFAGRSLNVFANGCYQPAVICINVVANGRDRFVATRSHVLSAVNVQLLAAMF